MGNRLCTLTSAQRQFVYELSQDLGLAVDTSRQLNSIHSKQLR